MKRYNNLYEKIIDIDNIEEAWRCVRKGKGDDHEAMRFGYYAFENILNIHNNLAWHRHRIGRYRSFITKEPKERHIQYLPLRDRVVQQAIHQVIAPIFDKGFIYDSYACRKEKGTHKAAYRLQYFLNAARDKWPGKTIYCLHCDIKKYFPNINHDVLYQEYARKIKCRETLALIKSYIKNYLLSVGMPIGTLLSQLSANIYMNVVDKFVKHDLREKYYARYMDNIVIIHHDRDHLKRVKDEIEGVLNNVLHLEYNRKDTGIGKAECGVNFVGYIIFHDHIRIKKSSLKRMKKRVRIMQAMYRDGRVKLNTVTQRIRSWLGHCCHANADSLVRHILDRAVFTREGEYTYE